MAAYVAVAPPDGEAGGTVFVRDGFTFPAFLVPVVWFLWHRMWMEAALALALTLLLGWLDGFGLPGAALASLTVALLFGLEAPSLRLWNLRRRGWHESGVVDAGDSFEAETRFFLRQDEGAAGDDRVVSSPNPSRPRPGAGLMLGLPVRRDA